MLPKRAIEEFKELYRDEYGVDLSTEEATALSSDLIRLFQTIALPHPDPNQVITKGGTDEFKSQVKHDPSANKKRESDTNYHPTRKTPHSRRRSGAIVGQSPIKSGL